MFIGNIRLVSRFNKKIFLRTPIGTPMPYINRVFFDDGIAEYSLNDWKKVIEPMLKDNDTRML